jgi:hypothetical protein
VSTGRKPSEDTIYARELGITGKKSRMVIRRLGGCEKLRALSPECRNILLAPMGHGNSLELHKGGLRARGMSRAKDIRLQND